jgi:hypothetical protein
LRCPTGRCAYSNYRIMSALSRRGTSSPMTAAPGSSPATSSPPEVCASASRSRSSSPTAPVRAVVGHAEPTFDWTLRVAETRRGPDAAAAADPPAALGAGPPEHGAAGRPHGDIAASGRSAPNPGPSTGRSALAARLSLPTHPCLHASISSRSAQVMDSTVTCHAPRRAAVRRALSLTFAVTYSSGMPGPWTRCGLAGLGLAAWRGARPR